MKNNTKKRQMEQQKQTKKLSSRYRRIFLLRYFLVGLFFANLYWFLMLLLSQNWSALLPLSLLVLSGSAYREQLKFANSTEHHFLLKKNRIYFKLQSVVMIFLLLSLFNRLFFNVFFPFLNFDAQLNLILGLTFTFVLLLSLFCQKRVGDIADNRDRYYLKYEKQ
jgi:hypothetical protein